MATAASFIATTRFGLGPKPGEQERIAADPRAWLVEQIVPPDLPPSALAGLPSSRDYLTDLGAARRQSGEEKMAARKARRMAHRKEVALRTRAQIEAGDPFHERLVAFWSNHFTVSVKKPHLFAIAGAYEREAIRPHVVGRFEDMLSAVLHHPAMLLYLDNVQSIGPNSPAGKRRHRGLNENLAREILELHTLGVDGGYAQEDVTELARILTGWSIGRQRDDVPGGFAFHARAHEPGAKTLLGVRYPESGIEEGETAFAALTRHPSTARHIATKLARHFIADEPPDDAVSRLATIFRDTEGDLAALARSLVQEDAAWANPTAKVKTPNDFVVSALRATGVDADSKRLVGSLELLGQAPFAAPSPAGWPDTGEHWIGPGATLSRAEWALAFGRRLAGHRPHEALVATTIEPFVSASTRLTIERAPSEAEAIALVLASPEFQRR
ncbi:MAG: DUF1800 domain-containing protein [Alphaproteobacteria bacterium]